MIQLENALSKNCKIKNRSRTFQHENGQKFKNSEPQLEFTGSYKKECIIDLPV